MRAKQKDDHHLSGRADDMPMMELQDCRFRQIGEGMLDNRARLALSRVLELLRETYGKDFEEARLHFTIHCNRAGEILLVPETTIPLKEVWLHRNASALKSVRAGIEQAEHGVLEDVGSFQQHADDEVE
jgi:hypothetical protein